MRGFSVAMVAGALVISAGAFVNAKLATPPWCVHRGGKCVSPLYDTGPIERVKVKAIRVWPNPTPNQKVESEFAHFQPGSVIIHVRMTPLQRIQNAWFHFDEIKRKRDNPPKNIWEAAKEISNAG